VGQHPLRRPGGLGLRVYLDERQLELADNWTKELSDALEHSRFLVLVYSQQAAASFWVEREWTAFLARHGRQGKIIPVLLEDVALPAFLTVDQGIKAHAAPYHRDAARVAERLARRIGRPGELPDGDARGLYFGQELVFTLAGGEPAWRVTAPDGRTRTAAPPWQADPGFAAALLGFQRLTRVPVRDDHDRADLVRHAATVGGALFRLLFDDAARDALRQASIAGQLRPVLTLRSDADALLALPWELLHDGAAFLVRDGRLDVVRTTSDEVGEGGLLREPAGPFRLVVNVSAPAGSGLDYEGESYRITRALAERCPMTPTELGTVADLVETVRREKATGVHFSGHGGPASWRSRTTRAGGTSWR